MFITRRSVKIRREPDSIKLLENLFRSVEIGSSEIIYMHLYTNRLAFSIKNDDSGNWWREYMHFGNITDIKRISQLFKSFESTDMLEISTVL